MHVDQLTVVTAFIFIAGLVFAAGVNHNRLGNLEEWRRELTGKLDKIDDGIRGLERLIRGEED